MRQDQGLERAAKIAALSRCLRRSVSAGLLAAASAVSASSPLLADALQKDVQTEGLEIVTAKGTIPFQVEIADTPAKQALGLMYRTTLGERSGMLFVHAGARELSMWMRNTFIPLDMVFIKADGVIHRIEANTEPMSERVISSQGAVSAVLEIAGGTAAALGLKPGDRIVHRHFAKGGE